MHQWYLSYNGQQMGPLDTAAAIAQAAKNPNGHCWRNGFAEWVPITACAELRSESVAGNVASPPPPARPPTPRCSCAPTNWPAVPWSRPARMPVLRIAQPGPAVLRPSV